MNARFTRLLSCAAGTVVALALSTGQALADETNSTAPLDLQIVMSVVPTGAEDAEAADASSSDGAEEPEEGNGLRKTEPQQGNGL